MSVSTSISMFVFQCNPCQHLTDMNRCHHVTWSGHISAPCTVQYQCTVLTISAYYQCKDHSRHTVSVQKSRVLQGRKVKVGKHSAIGAMHCALQLTWELSKKPGEGHEKRHLTRYDIQFQVILV